MNQLYQHSYQKPIYRVAACKPLENPLSVLHMNNDSASSSTGNMYDDDAIARTANNIGSYLFIAAGENETALYGIPSGGECLRCFRSVSLSSSDNSATTAKDGGGAGGVVTSHGIAPLPVLNTIELPRNPTSPITSAIDCYYDPVANITNSYLTQFNNTQANNSHQHTSSSSALPPSYQYLHNTKSLAELRLKYQSSTSIQQHSYRALLGRVSDRGTSYLVTGGTDKIIRYWDFSSPMKCYVVSGLLPCQPKSTFEAPFNEKYKNKLYLSYDSDVPSNHVMTQAHLPIKENRGPLQPLNNCKDSITDLKCIDIPLRMMLSSCRDGEIKVWR